MARDHWRRRHTSTLRGDSVPATPTECSVSRKAGFMLQILPCWSTVNIGKLMLSMFIVSPPCHGMHRVLAGCSESVRWDCSVVSLAAATHRGHGGLSASARRMAAPRDEEGPVPMKRLIEPRRNYIPHQGRLQARQAPRSVGKCKGLLSIRQLRSPCAHQTSRLPTARGSSWMLEVLAKPC